VEIALRIPSELSLIEEVVELVARHCFAGWDPSRRVQFRFRVALSEALANAMVYGNGQEPALHVEVRAECLPDALHIHVTDEGPGFDPASVRDPVMPDDLELPCGRGLWPAASPAPRPSDPHADLEPPQGPGLLGMSRGASVDQRVSISVQRGDGRGGDGRQARPGDGPRPGR